MTGSSVLLGGVISTHFDLMLMFSKKSNNEVKDFFLFFRNTNFSSSTV